MAENRGFASLGLAHVGSLLTTFHIPIVRGARFR